MTDLVATTYELSKLERLIASWLADQLETNPVVLGVERGESGERRWYVRLKGEDKDIYSIWLTLRQRTLHFETYFLPAPEDNGEACFAHLLRRNAKLYGIAFSIGEEDSIFLGGQISNSSISVDELDRMLGSIYSTVEACFLSTLRIGFASRFP